MTLIITPTQFRIEDSATGRTLVSTSQRMLHGLDRHEGSRVFPAVSTAFRSHALTTASYAVGSCDAGATHVIGSIRVAWEGTANRGCVPGNDAGTTWWNYNGSMMIYMRRADTATGLNAGFIQSPERYSLSAWCQVTFRPSGGTLYLDEVTFVRGFTITDTTGAYTQISRQEFTLYWRLRTCALT